MSEIDLIKLVRSFRERRKEADPKAQQVLDEFIRVAKSLSADSSAWAEVISLDQSWRDTLSDSQVINYLRALHPERPVRKSKRQRE
jgi:hypothetical protein